jgi:serine/threonine protein kinase/CheY-like chemotaxis protein
MNYSDYTLLVVDDEEMNRDMLSRRLERFGFRVHMADSGAKALEMIQKQKFDMVLLDVMMPGMDGLEVLTTIRESHSIVDLPVIMVTARDQSGDVVAALQLGANDYVTKPINFPITFARVQTHLSIKHANSVAAHKDRSMSGEMGRSHASVHSFDGRTSAPRDSSIHGQSVSGAQNDAFRKSDSNAGADTKLDQPGTVERQFIGEYEILSELGRGGMGVVYKARHLRMNRLVGLKVIDKNHLLNPNAVRRFYQEIEAAAKLSHPNVVMAFDAGQHQDTHYFAMEYVEGIDLARLVRDSGPIPAEQAADYIRQSALGLHHAYERGLVHRDIKPSNLLVTWVADPGDQNSVGGFKVARFRSRFTRKSVVKILDMGLARFGQAQEPMGGLDVTREGHVVGTADYMAPEQWMNPHTVDIRADLYSLGCTLYFLLTGQVPFPGDMPMEKMLKHNLDQPTPVDKFRQDVEPRIVDVLNRLMAKRPEERFQTPMEVAEALK